MAAVSIKLDPEVHAKAKKLAKLQKRSLAGQIAYYVEEMVKAEQAAEESASK